jgi:hypothetical protein
VSTLEIRWGYLVCIARTRPARNPLFGRLMHIRNTKTYSSLRGTMGRVRMIIFAIHAGLQHVHSCRGCERQNPLAASRNASAPMIRGCGGSPIAFEQITEPATTLAMTIWTRDWRSWSRLPGLCAYDPSRVPEAGGHSYDGHTTLRAAVLALFSNPPRAFRIQPRGSGVVMMCGSHA